MRKMVNWFPFQRETAGALHWFLFVVCVDGTMWLRNVSLGGEWISQEGPPDA